MTHTGILANHRIAETAPAGVRGGDRTSLAGKSARGAELLLAGVIMVRATSGLFTKVGLRSLDPFNLIGLRFGIAFVILALVFHRRLLRIHRSTLLRGFLLGTVFFALMGMETLALRRTAVSTVSFLENTAIVWVPLAVAVLTRKLPSWKTMVSVAVTISGVFCMTIGGGGLQIGAGELLCLGGSLLYTASILMTAKFSREEDPVLLGMIQVGFMAAYAWGASFLFEAPAIPAAPVTWGAILYTAVICTVFGFTLQPVAQKRVSVDRAGLFCAISPLTAMTTGAIFLHERPGAFALAGAAVILLGIGIRMLPERDRQSALLRRRHPAHRFTPLRKHAHPVVQ